MVQEDTEEYFEDSYLQLDRSSEGYEADLKRAISALEKRAGREEGRAVLNTSAPVQTTPGSTLALSKKRWSSQSEIEKVPYGSPYKYSRISHSSYSLNEESSVTRSQSSGQLSNTQDSGTLPDGWERVDSKSGVYYWHIPSGTTQYQHPSLSSNLDLLSEQVTDLHLSKPEKEDERRATFNERDEALPEDHYRVMNLGYMDLEGKEVKAANSSVTINECIRKLSSLLQDPAHMASQSQVLTFEGNHMKLMTGVDGPVLTKQDILSIRRWGVGSDDVRNFAYVVRQRHTSIYRCYVLHCTTCAASHLALRLQEICKNASRAPVVMSEQSLTPSEDLPEPKRFETLYLGYIRVEKEKGTDVVQHAIEKLRNSNQSNWESVTMEVHVSTVNLIKTADRTLLAEHRVRFISFMALGQDESYLGYVVHGGPKIFYCHVYQSDGSCAEVARAIQEACTVRYQLLLSKQEEMKKAEKPEPQGIFSFLRKKLKQKSSSDVERT